MEPIVLAFGPALVGAIATDDWPRVREAVTGLWRREPARHRADDIGTELDELREQVVLARRDGDTSTEGALEGAWHLRLQQLLRADPEMADELRRVLEQVLTRTLTPAEQTQDLRASRAAAGHRAKTAAGRCCRGRPGWWPVGL